MSASQNHNHGILELERALDISIKVSGLPNSPERNTEYLVQDHVEFFKICILYIVTYIWKTLFNRKA